MEFRARPYYPKDNEIQPYYIKFAQAGSLLFMVGSILAMLLFPHYDIHEKYLSDLGIEQRSAFVFNNTVIASALILTPVFLGMYWYLLPLVDSRSHFMLGLGTITGVIGMVALIFVGYYPATGETLASHNFYAMLFFILLALSLFFLVSTVVYIIEQKDEEDPDPWLYAGYSYVPLVVLLSDMSTW